MMAICWSVMIVLGSEPIMSKKFLKMALKSVLVYEFVRQMPKGIVLLLLFLPKNSPRPHFRGLSPGISLISLTKLYVMSKETNWPKF